MIEIRLVKGYKESQLKFILEKIKSVAPRELTYGVKSSDVDINIEDKNSIVYATDYSRISNRFPNTLWIVVGLTSYVAHYQGERYAGKSLDEIIYDMFE